MDKKNSIGILILFFEKPEQTWACIQSFLPSQCLIYVLNNGSSVAASTFVKEKVKSHKYVRWYDSNENLGPSNGRNFLIKQSTEKWLFFVDNDITIYPINWTEFISDRWEFHDVVLPKLYNKHEKEFAEHPFFNLDNGIVTTCFNEKANNFFPSGASIVKRDLFDAFGEFDKKMGAFEDYEYAIRLLKSDYSLKILEEQNISLVHEHVSAKNENDRKAIKERYDDDRLSTSFSRLEIKHDIVFNHDWSHWVQKQVFDMTSNNLFKKAALMIQRLFYR